MPMPCRAMLCYCATSSSSIFHVPCPMSAYPTSHVFPAPLSSLSYPIPYPPSIPPSLAQSTKHSHVPAANKQHLFISVSPPPEKRGPSTKKRIRKRTSAPPYSDVVVVNPPKTCHRRQWYKRTATPSPRRRPSRTPSLDPRRRDPRPQPGVATMYSRSRN